MARSSPTSQIGDWSMPWNASPTPAGSPRHPEVELLGDRPGGIDQVGCVYTAQGFEYDYAGVIFGRDLVYRPGRGWIGQARALV